MRETVTPASGRERPDADTAGDGGLERARDLVAVQPENQNVDGSGCLLDRRDDRDDAGVGLDDELHTARNASKVLAISTTSKLGRFSGR